MNTFFYMRKNNDLFSRYSDFLFSRYCVIFKISKEGGGLAKFDF